MIRDISPCHTIAGPDFIARGTRVHPSHAIINSFHNGGVSRATERPHGRSVSFVAPVSERSYFSERLQKVSHHIVKTISSTPSCDDVVFLYFFFFVGVFRAAFVVFFVFDIVGDAISGKYFFIGSQYQSIQP